CNNCNEVLEFCDPRIQQIQNMMGDLLHFNIQNHSLTLYGEPRIDENGKCLTCLKNLA
ncbi:MAG: transcriptional repressor, partial [Bacteroidetes bacterium SW_10_40_5]